VEINREALTFGLIQFIMLLGLFGLAIPVFPGMLVMWLGALAFGFLSGWGTLGVVLFLLITVLAIAGSLADNVLMGVGARRGGASWTTIGVALVAGILGTLIFPPFGGIIAAPGAVLLLEYNRLRDWNKVWEAVRGLGTGWLLSFFVRFGFGAVIMVVWWFWVWRS